MPPTDAHETMSARAERAVGKHQDDDYVLKPAQHAKLLPADAAPLKRILDRPEIETIRQDYVKWDQEAGRLQGRHLRWGKRGICASMVAAVIAVFLIVSPVELTPPQLVAAAVSVWGLLCVAWGYFVSMMLYRPLEAWLKSRANAEEYRKRLFEAVLAADETATSGEIAVLPLQLAYFRRYQFDMQRAYFKSKSSLFKRRAWRTDAVGWLLAILPVVALALTVAAGISAAGEQGLIHPLLTRLGGAVHRVEAWSIDVVGFGAAIIVAAMSAGLFAIAQLDNYRRNAGRYANMLKRLEEMELDPRLGFNYARAAADAGNRAPVERLVREMHALMTSELTEWVSVGVVDTNKVIVMPERKHIPGHAYELRTGPGGATDLIAGTKLSSADFTGIRTQTGAPPLKARKIGFVAGREVTAVEQIVTRWNGKESTDAAKPGDWVVTNMSASREILRDRDGHQNTYVIRAENFPRLYDRDVGTNDFGQVYKSKSVVEAFLLPGSFEILAPWGELQRGAQGYLIDNGKEVYGNNRETFEATYEIVSPSTKAEDR